MSRITITIAIDVPDNAKVSMDGGLMDAPPDDWSPSAYDDGGGEAWGNPQICPDHKVAFTWKDGGISKAGKPYDGFWKCGQKNPDGSYCQKKPQ